MLQEIPDAVRALINQPQYRQQSEIEVEPGYIYNTCAASMNGNPLFWNAETAQRLTQGPIAPPTMLSAWLRPHYWRPGAADECLALQTHFDLKEKLGLPEAVIASNELVLGAPVRVGDRLTSWQVVRSVSDLKTTRLGHGRFWVVEAVFENQSGEFVGSDSYTAFAYVRPAGTPS